MTDGGKEHRFRLAGLLRRLGHLLQRLLHLHAGGNVHQHTNGHVFITIARMDEADLQIGIVAGQDINKIDLLPTDNLRQSLAVLMRKHIEIGMRQFVT